MARASRTYCESRDAGRRATFISSIDRRLQRPRVRRRASVNERDLATRLLQTWNRGRPIVFSFWLAGAVMCALVAVRRIVRFERMLRNTLPASARLQQLALEITRKFGISQVPDLRYVEWVETPLLWCAGHRPTIVLPMGLLRELDEQQAAMILAHELGHLRRRDHWVRALELLISTLYWWNPLVWMIRRRIHQAEDLCCDAWVGRAFPNCDDGATRSSCSRRPSR